MSTTNIAMTTEVVEAFQSAWSESTKDYSARLINSEHTLQSVVYHHLRRFLSNKYAVFTEAVIRFPDGIGAEANKRKVVVDLLICHQEQIIAAIEVKYTPRGAPSVDSVRKDILSLSRIKNRRRREDRVSVEMPRFRSMESDALVLSICPIRKLVFAVYCKRDAPNLRKSEFWSRFSPDTGYWQHLGSMPRNLGVALALADEKGKAECDYFGGPFERFQKST